MSNLNQDNLFVKTAEHTDSGAPLNWALGENDLDNHPEIRELVREESLAPVEVGRDLSLRAKVIDACGLTCTFCHNEGTPVAIDNRSGSISIRGTTGQSGRISVFSAINGVDFLPGRMEPKDPSFSYALNSLKTALGLRELHLTGGEPTLHPFLPQLISVAREAGYSVSMTSNGERGASQIEACAERGLSKINFSIFGTTPEELAEVQHSKFSDVSLAQRKISALHESIETAANAGITVAANLVMGSQSHEGRVERLIKDFDPRLDLRILPDLSHTQESAVAIYALLTRLGARPLVRQIEAGSSNARVRYTLPNGRIIAFKQIRPVRLEECNTCEFNNPEDCMEGYYGLRLYVDSHGTYKVGICLQRMDYVQPLDDFIGSTICQEVLSLREREYSQMRQIYS